MPIEIDVDGEKIEVDDKVAKYFETKYENNPAIFDKASKVVAKNILSELSPQLQEILKDKIKPNMKGKDLGNVLSNAFIEELEKNKSKIEDKTKDETKSDMQKQLDEIKRENAEKLAAIQKQAEQDRISDKILSFKEKLKAKAIKKNLRAENEIVYENYLEKFFKFEFEDGKIQVRKLDGDLFFNKDGKDPSDDDIVDFIKDKFPGLHISNTPGAGIGPGKDNKQVNRDGKQIDLTKSSKQLINEGYDELPNPKELGQFI